MNDTQKKYLEKSLRLLEKHLPYTADQMLAGYPEKGRDGEIGSWMTQTDSSGLFYCLFSWPMEAGERAVLLVYDEKDRIIADFSAVLCSVKELLYSRDLYDLLSEESDWMYLEHYTLCSYMFEDIPYPGCEAGPQNREYDGEAFLCCSAYVTKSFRRKGIFSEMLQMMNEFTLRKRKGAVSLYSVFSLDPDVACYGPDAEEEPYHYRYEKDEPDRMRNRMILEKYGYETLRLQETEPDPEADGTKLWFAVCREDDVIIETDDAMTA